MLSLASAGRYYASVCVQMVLCIGFIDVILFVCFARPLSKTVRFNVLKVIPAGSSGGAKKAFTAI